MAGCVSEQAKESVFVGGSFAGSWRADFPALAPCAARDGAAQGGEQSWAYLDSAATTQMPQTVIDVMDSVHAHLRANPYRGVHRASMEATDAYERARSAVAAFAGADEDEIVFVRNATEALNLVACSYAAQVLEEGDEVLIPISEHHSNLVPWQRVCASRGARLIYLKLDEQGRLSCDELERAIGSRTKIVACAHVSNVLGTVFPVEKIVSAAHSHGAKVVLDCAQSAGHLPLDFHGWDVDFAAFSGHKMYGPMGIGVLFGKRELLAGMEPFLLGGEMVDAVWQQRTLFQDPPRRFEAGTPNVEGALGLQAAIGYVSSIGFDAIRAHEGRLARRLVEGLAACGCVSVLGNSSYDADRLGIASFCIESVDPQDAGLLLDERGIAVRTGSHCAQPLLRALQVESCCRASVGLYTSIEDVDRLIEGVAQVRRTIGRRIMGMFP